MENTPKIEMALQLVMQLRPDWAIEIDSIHFDKGVVFKAKKRLLAPGNRVTWMTPFNMHTEWMGVGAVTAEVGFSIKHADIDLFNDVAPEILRFIKD